MHCFPWARQATVGLIPKHGNLNWVDIPPHYSATNPHYYYYTQIGCTFGQVEPQGWVGGWTPSLWVGGGACGLIFHYYATIWPTDCAQLGNSRWRWTLHYAQVEHSLWWWVSSLFGGGRGSEGVLDVIITQLGGWCPGICPKPPGGVIMALLRWPSAIWVGMSRSILAGGWWRGCRSRCRRTPTSQPIQLTLCLTLNPERTIELALGGRQWQVNSAHPLPCIAQFGWLHGWFWWVGGGWWAWLVVVPRWVTCFFPYLPPWTFQVSPDSSWDSPDLAVGEDSLVIVPRHPCKPYWVVVPLFHAIDIPNKQMMMMMMIISDIVLLFHYYSDISDEVSGEQWPNYANETFRQPNVVCCVLCHYYW